MKTSITTLDGYLREYGTYLGISAKERLDPIHVPERDAVDNCDEFLRSPFEPQAHLITAGRKLLSKNSTALMVCECGTGKTIMALQTVHHAHKGKPYRALVFCPPQLVKKWEREIRDTIKDVDVIQLQSYKQLLPYRKNDKPVKCEWWIVKETAAKMGAPWIPSYEVNKNQLPVCPDCGQEVVDKKDIPIAPDVLERRRTQHDGSEENPGCGSPLWTYCHEDSGNTKWDIAQYTHKRLRGFFDYFIVDEVHEERGRDSARAVAMGKLAAASKKCIALTGTLAGGYAWQIRTILMRLSPSSLCEDGFDWTNEMAFNEVFGRIERKVTKKELPADDNRQSRGKSRRTVKSVKPGIMPSLFGHHLMDKCMFLSLDELAENLPPLIEDVHSCDMDEEIAEEYERIEKELRKALKPMVSKGDKRLLSNFLRVLLSYPDYPHDWGWIGYNEQAKDDDGNITERFVPVVQPKSFDRNVVRPKNKKLVNYILKEKKDGRQCWVYLQDTNKRDMLVILKKQLEDAGLNTIILRSNTVSTEDREEWIKENGHKADVILSHPQLVQTGLDLFDKGGRHNFVSLIFFQTGYELYTLRQASRRHWRIGQKEICKVAYFFYGGTMQERAMSLMGKKLVASEAIEGKFTAEGLAALAGDSDTMEVALARDLVSELDKTDVDREWKKITFNSQGNPDVVVIAEKEIKKLVREKKHQFISDDGIVLRYVPPAREKLIQSLFEV